MRHRLVAGSLGLALAAALDDPGPGQDPGLLLRGQPGGFEPALYTAGTTFNASSRPIYSRLVQFDRGTTDIDAGCSRKLGHLRRRSRIHVPSA